MQIVRAAPRPWQATAWHDAAGVAASGTSHASAGNMDIDISGLAGVTAARVEIEFEQAKTGGSGYMDAYVVISQNQGTASISSGGSQAPNFNTGILFSNSSTPTRRRVSVPVGVLQPLNSSNNVLRVQVWGKGSAADTEFALTNVRARLLYQTL